MKKKTEDCYVEVIETLRQLKKNFPSYNMGRHISTALDGYGDPWGITDKELLYALLKYKTQLELDEPHLIGDEEVEEIIKDGINLENIFKDEEDFINGQDY